MKPHKNIHYVDKDRHICRAIKKSKETVNTKPGQMFPLGSLLGAPVCDNGMSKGRLNYSCNLRVTGTFLLIQICFVLYIEYASM